MEITIGKTTRFVVLLDEEDCVLVSGMNWTNINQRYAISTRKPCVLMHRFILGLSDPSQQVDHINSNGFDNRRANLRICTHAENMRNRRVSKSNKSGYKGVYAVGAGYAKPWRAEIKLDGQKILLGLFGSAYEAHLAYQAAARKFHQEFARFE